MGGQGDTLSPMTAAHPLQGGRFAQSFELGGSLVLCSLNFFRRPAADGLAGPVPLQVNRPYLAELWSRELILQLEC